MSNLILYKQKLQNQAIKMQLSQSQRLNRVQIEISGRVMRISPDFLIGSKLLQKILKKNIQNFSSQNQKIILKLENSGISVPVIARLNRIFEGESVQFVRDQSVQKIIQTCQILQIESILELVINDLIENFQEYDFFTVFSFGQKYNLNRVQKKCIRNLIKYRFQQLNFNRYALLQCQQKIFQKVIQLYKQFKRQSRKGPSRDNVKQIIREYSQIHQIILSAQEILSDNLEQISQEQEEIQQEQIKNNSNSTAEDCEISNSQEIICGQALYGVKMQNNLKSFKIFQNQQRNKGCKQKYNRRYSNFELNKNKLKDQKKLDLTQLITKFSMQLLTKKKSQKQNYNNYYL